MVSGSLSSARRGSSHLSIALLSSLSVVKEYLALRDGPRGFNRDFTWPDLLRYLSGDHIAFTYWTVTICGWPFHAIRLTSGLVTPMRVALLPRKGKPLRFGLFRFRSPLLTKSIFLSFPPGTEMFQFPGLTAATYGFSSG